MSAPARPDGAALRLGQLLDQAANAASAGDLHRTQRLIQQARALQRAGHPASEAL
jgi:hypothetical protein